MVKNRLLILLQEKGAKQGERITQKDLAMATGITEATLSNWIKGKVDRFDAKVIDAICEYFDCQVGDLLEYIREK